MIWVINSNSNSCKIYHYQRKPMQLTLVKEITHPEGRLKTSEYLTSAKPGHYQTSKAAHGTYSPHSDPKEVEVNHFSREIAKELEAGRLHNKYEKIILISAPHMNGLIHQHLNEHVQAMISHNIHKDLLHLTNQELLDFLRDHTKFQEMS